MESNEFEVKMKKYLSQLGLSQWVVLWLPNSLCSVRGRTVPEKLMIEIYDLDEDDGWDTFIHEIVEIKLRSALRPYRILVNKLIEGYQELVDGARARLIRLFWGFVLLFRNPLFRLI